MASKKMKATAAEIRAWARKQRKLVVGTRGRISAEVREAYAKAHG